MPLRAGPAIAPVLNAMACKEKAFGRSSRGTRLGTRDCRAGKSNAMAEAWMAVRT